jgi:hypothetical protein
MNCHNCNCENIITTLKTEWIPYGDVAHAFQATFPVMTCTDCSFSWTDYRKENAVELAAQEYLESREGSIKEDSIEDFSQKVRELLAEHIDDAGNREAYREALILLAAEL